MLAVKKILIVQSIGGARGDFVAGWLGSLSGFVDNQWVIDNETGKSTILSNFFKQLPYVDGPAPLQSVLTDHGYRLDPDSDCMLAGTAVRPNIQQYLTEDQYPQVAALTICTRSADAREIFWQYMVKTYMVNTRIAWFREHGQSYGIDNYLLDRGIEINDQNRVNEMQQLMGSWRFREPPSVSRIKNYVLEYESLFCPGGSVRLCKTLGIEARSWDHAAWDRKLIDAQTPDTVERWGKVWNKQDQIAEKLPSDFVL